jgi:hypothetical protein
MSRTIWSLGRVAVGGQDNFSLELFSATDSVVEVVDLEPERDAVPVRP